MAGFRKAQPRQAALKIAVFGAPGSGKTFTALLIAEGLAKLTGKRVAFVDTEHGTDFYVQNIPDRSVHPDPFDIDCLYTRSLAEVYQAVRSLSPDEYCCVVIDSVTHLWEAAKGSFRGKLTSAGTIPMHGWAQIKRPYKELENYLMNSPLHVLLLGRQGVDYQEDEESGELKALGFKMKAEGETPYEPNLLIRMEATRAGKGRPSIITAVAEKDRTGILAGRVIEWPDFDSIAKPILGALSGDEQAHIDSADEARSKDVEAMDDLDRSRAHQSAELRKNFAARYQLAQNWQEVEEIGKLITPDVKAKMTTDDLTSLREIALEAMSEHPKPDKDKLVSYLLRDGQMLGWDESELLKALKDHFPDWKNRAVSTLTIPQLEAALRFVSREMEGEAAERVGD